MSQSTLQLIEEYLEARDEMAGPPQRPGSKGISDTISDLRSADNVSSNEVSCETEPLMTKTVSFLGDVSVNFALYALSLVKCGTT